MQRRRILIILLLFIATHSLRAQQNPDQTEIVRINAELVQTGVTVFDKQGRFVDGLKKEDFEIRVANRVVPISFFENIVAGSQKDRLTRPAGDQTPPKDELSYRRRTIIFFLDDRHLSLDSVSRTREMLLEFINKQMGQNDLVAIASASGQIGFLQQFTDNKDVLREAASRLNHVPYTVTDYGKNSGSPMTEYMALTIERRDDANVLEFFVNDCLKFAPRAASVSQRVTNRRHCEIEVQNRARQVLLQAGAVTSATYTSLETLLQSAGRLPGSKLAFFISDGFLADVGPRGRTGSDQIGSITDQARRSGVVIYTVDARGLISGALDASGNVPFDPNGTLETANTRQIFATQDALNALAVDTGGRALRNQNYFDRFVTDALVETSRYYLIAWRPEANETSRETIKKIEVSVIGRPDLVVRAARGFVSNSTMALKPAPTKPSDKTPDSELDAALADFLPINRLPVELSLIYVDTPDNGIVLTSSVQAPAEALSYGDQNNEPAKLSFVGVVLDDRGKPAGTFKTTLKVNPSPSTAREKNTAVIYNHRFRLKPGIYQARVAARDEGSGTVGSTIQWIVIPDLSKRRLSLSSLILGIENVTNQSGETVQWSVDKKFAQHTRLQFMTFIYNSAAPDLAAQVNVYKDGSAVASTPFRKVVREGDPDRILWRSEINLKDFQPGRYLLEVIIEDQATHQRASQQTPFYIQ